MNKKRALVVTDEPLVGDARVLDTVSRLENNGFLVDIKYINLDKESVGSFRRASLFLIYSWLIINASISKVSRFIQLARSYKVVEKYKWQWFGYEKAAFAETFRLFVLGTISKNKFPTYDVIVTNDLRALCFAVGLGQHKALFFHDAHELAIFRNRRKMSLSRSLLLFMAESAMLKRVDKLWTVSKSIAEIYGKLYGHCDINVRYNDLFDDDRLIIEKQRSKNNTLNSSKVCIIYTGVIKPHRGFSQLALVAKNYPCVDIHLFSVKDHNIARLHLVDTFGDNYKNRVTLHCEKNYRQKAIDILSEYELALSWCWIQNNCLSYYFSLPNKLFQAHSFGCLPIINIDTHLGKRFKVEETAVVLLPKGLLSPDIEWIKANKESYIKSFNRVVDDIKALNCEQYFFGTDSSTSQM